MNYHYIEYMIKERQREELEACERRRLLKPAGHPQVGLVHMARSVFLSAIRRFKEQRMFRYRRLQVCFFTENNIALTKRDSQ